MPTLLRAAGITPPADLPGIDLLDPRALAGRKTLFGSLFVHTAVESRQACRQSQLPVRHARGWVEAHTAVCPNRDATLMIDGRAADWMRVEPELYNTLDDPREEKNLAAELAGSGLTVDEKWHTVAKQYAKH